ncbi:hypothetical protein BH18GEM1_BH18GEM1_06850 [soil metagenome]
MDRHPCYFTQPIRKKWSSQVASQLVKLPCRILVEILKANQQRAVRDRPSVIDNSPGRFIPPARELRQPRPPFRTETTVFMTGSSEPRVHHIPSVPYQEDQLLIREKGRKEVDPASSGVLMNEKARVRSPFLYPSFEQRPESVSESSSELIERETQSPQLSARRESVVELLETVAYLQQRKFPVPNRPTRGRMLKQNPGEEVRSRSRRDPGDVNQLETPRRDFDIGTGLHTRTSHCIGSASARRGRRRSNVLQDRLSHPGPAAAVQMAAHILRDLTTFLAV